MADFSALKTAIQANIRTNANEEITGAILQEILLSMVTTLGDGAINGLVTALQAEVVARQNAVGGEATARQEADSALSGRINGEATARGEADTQLQNAINGITTRLNEGYVYVGIATPSTNHGTPAGKVFYIALQAGTYTDFGSLAVTQGITILKYNGTAWSQEQLVGIDDVPTKESNKLVKSGGVFANIGAFDISEYNKSGSTLATYADLTAALAALPSDFQKGGMSIKFVQSSDNKYVQYRLLSEQFTTNTCYWYNDYVEDEIQKINLEINKVSKNMGVKAGIGNTLDFLINIPNGKTFKVKINNTDGSVTQIGQRLRVNGSAWGTTYINKNTEYTFVADTDIYSLGVYIDSSDITADGFVIFDVYVDDTIEDRIVQNISDIAAINFKDTGLSEEISITQNTQAIIDKACYIQEGEVFSFIVRCDDGCVHNIGQRLRINGAPYGSQYLNENVLYTFTAPELITTIGIYIGTDSIVKSGSVTLDVFVVNSTANRLNENTDDLKSNIFADNGLCSTIAITQNTQEIIDKSCYIRKGETFRFCLRCDDGCVHNVGQRLRINGAPYGTQYLNENIVYEFTAPELITLIGIYVASEAAVGNGNVTLDVTIVDSVDYRIDELDKKLANLHSIFGKNIVVFGDSIMQIMATTEFPSNTVSYVDSEDNEYTSADITIIDGKIWLTSSLSGGVPTEDSIQLDIKNSAQQIFDNQDWLTLKNKLGVNNLYNMGLGGASIFGREIETSYPYDGTVDAKTCCLANEVRWLVRRYNNNEVNNPDCILIWLGTNDSTYPNKTVDNYDDVMALTFAELDSDANYSYRATFYGGLRWSLEKLYLTFPHINIILATPTQAKHFERPYARQIEIGDMIKKMASRYSCIVVDACREIGVVDIFEPNRFTYDGLHPNANGKILWTNFIANKLLNEYSNR